MTDKEITSQTDAKRHNKRIKRIYKHELARRRERIKAYELRQKQRREREEARLLHEKISKEQREKKANVRKAKEKATIKKTSIRKDKDNKKMLKRPKRYQLVFDLISEIKPNSILEIGTWSGKSGEAICKKALEYNDDVTYYGFDLFEDADEETDANELNVKQHYTLREVTTVFHNIKRENSKFTYQLYKGNTKQTLSPIMVDVVLIDGGHSVETIESDYNNVKHSRVIVFDDYYMSDSDGNLPDLTKFGCNTLVDSLIIKGKNIKLIEPPKDDDNKITDKSGGIVWYAVLRNDK